LIVLGILLGKGTQVEKANFLFEQWDIDINKKVNNEELDKILDDLYTVAVEFLPNCEPGIKENPELA
jgi:hypothetical protein